MRPDEKQASHEIFGTPENESFFSTKPYAELDPSQREIRLLKVLPGSRNSLVKCKLLSNRRLTDIQGQYTALSYCAGDLKRTDTIIVNGVRCNVFANLNHALVEARHFWKQTHKRRCRKSNRCRSILLWVDQICINQKDIRERSHQVGFMRDIYEQAKQVLVCLSTPGISSMGLKWLSELASRIPAHADDADQKPWTKPEEPYYEDYHHNRLLQYILNGMPDEGFTQGWRAFYDVIESPWWERAWVFQEFVVAAQVHILYRGCSMNWNVLWPSLRSLVYVHRRHFFGYLSYYQQFLAADPHIFEDHGHERMRKVGEHMWNIELHKALDRVHFMGHSRVSSHSKLDLQDLLVHSRICRSSDPRDKVYAFLGLGDPGYEIQPVYSESLAEVLIETTRRIITFENSLNVLYYAIFRNESQGRILPSWVVDWTQSKYSENGGGFLREEQVSKEYCQKSANASFNTVRRNGHNHLCLEVEGRFVDRFDKYMECRVTERHGDMIPYDEIWLLHGAGYLVVLRREVEGYRFISPVVCRAPLLYGHRKQPSLSRISIV